MVPVVMHVFSRESNFGVAIAGGAPPAKCMPLSGECASPQVEAAIDLDLGWSSSKRQRCAHCAKCLQAQSVTTPLP
jgi:hypothetical protein